MNYRELGRTGWQVSEIGFGAWGIGGDWGPVQDDESLAEGCALLESQMIAAVDYLERAADLVEEQHGDLATGCRELVQEFEGGGS